MTLRRAGRHFPEKKGYSPRFSDDPCHTEDGLMNRHLLPAQRQSQALLPCIPQDVRKTQVAEAIAELQKTGLPFAGNETL